MDFHAFTEEMHELIKTAKVVSYKKMLSDVAEHAAKKGKQKPTSEILDKARGLVRKVVEEAGEALKVRETPKGSPEVSFEEMKEMVTPLTTKIVSRAKGLTKKNSALLPPALRQGQAIQDILAPLSRTKTIKSKPSSMQDWAALLQSPDAAMARLRAAAGQQ